MTDPLNISHFLLKYQERCPLRVPTEKQLEYRPKPSREVKPKPVRIDMTDKIINSQPSVKPKRYFKEETEEPIPATAVRVSIDYFGEKEKGNMADSVGGRVIYRGYAARNTFYYIKTIREIKPMPIYQPEELIFNSKFEAGNLNAAVRIAAREYWLFTREDTNSKGLSYWFNFQVRAKKDMTVTFRIYRFSKMKSLYSKGMRPFMRPVDEKMTSLWKQMGDSVDYIHDETRECYYLKFDMKMNKGEQWQIATQPSYTYSDLRRFMGTLQAYSNVRLETLGETLAGLEIPLLTINSETITNQPKQSVVVLARTHPGQTCSSFTIQNFIIALLNNKLLLDKYTFHIVPMVNPDGVVFGNHRTSVAGSDLNRRFCLNPDPELYPQVAAVCQLLQNLSQRRIIAHLFDLHGHSTQTDIFAYGSQSDIKSGAYIIGRIIPKLLDDRMECFRLDKCVFKRTKQKGHTARVFFEGKYGINALTFEQSYGLSEGKQIGERQWRHFGEVLVDALEISSHMTLQDGQKLLQQYIIAERQRQRLRKEKLKKQFQHIATCPAEEKPHKTLKTQSSTVLETKPKPKTIIQILEVEQQQSIGSLDSGDSQHQIAEDQEQFLRQQVQANLEAREIAKRQLYIMTDKRVEFDRDYPVSSYYTPQNRNSTVPRLIKLQMKRSEAARETKVKAQVQQDQDQASVGRASNAFLQASNPLRGQLKKIRYDQGLQLQLNALLQSTFEQRSSYVFEVVKSHNRTKSTPRNYDNSHRQMGVSMALSQLESSMMISRRNYSERKTNHNYSPSQKKKRQLPGIVESPRKAKLHFS